MIKSRARIDIFGHGFFAAVNYSIIQLFICTSF